MEFSLNFKVNAAIYLKNPESSETGKQMVKHAIELFHETGFEHFTFKKLAARMGTTEATIYRYFENKHRILLYILNWYWSYMAFLLHFKTQNVHNEHEQLLIAIDLLTGSIPANSGVNAYNTKLLNEIVVAESSKTYLTKEVSEINKSEVFKPYKELCAHVADIIHAYNPSYKYPKSLSATIIETAHQQHFFSKYLPRLTDQNKKANPNYTKLFIQDFVFKILDT